MKCEIGIIFLIKMVFKWRSCHSRANESGIGAKTEFSVIAIIEIQEIITQLSAETKLSLNLKSSWSEMLK